MGLEVIGAGFGRTGTMSLKLALEQLGYGPCYHMMEVAKHPEHRPLWSAAHEQAASAASSSAAGRPIEWDALFADYRATTDWPACNLWRELVAHYPEARVLLSLRDADDWYDSVMSTIYPTTERLRDADDPELQAFGRWSQDVVWQYTFDGRLDDRAHVTGVFERHNEAVIATVPADRLLVFEARDGWPPLCRFLGVPEPEDSYPRINTRDQFPAPGAAS